MNCGEVERRKTSEKRERARDRQRKRERVIGSGEKKRKVERE